MKRLLSISLLVLALSGCWETSKGVKVGTIVKLAAQGFLVKTYEGQLIRGGMSDGSGVLGQQFDFTIEDQAILDLAESAMNNQKKVKITYHTEFLTFLRSESESNFVDKVEIID